MFEIPRFDPSKVKGKLSESKERSTAKTASTATTSADLSTASRYDADRDVRKRRRHPDKKTLDVEEDFRRVDTPKKSTLRVVAPEQPTSTADTPDPLSTVNAAKNRHQLLSRYAFRTHGGGTDEATDDFDDLLFEGGKDEEAKEEEIEAKISASSDAATWKEIEFAIQMSKLPIVEAAKLFQIPEFLISNLQRDGYRHFFPIQCLTIPDIIASERSSLHFRSRDVCCTAPTGSGKTLAFVIPILHALHQRIIVRLAALIVLPSRDLATQVFSVFQKYSQGSDLRIGLAIGQTDFVEEQRALVVGRLDNDTFISPTEESSSYSQFFFQPTDPITSALALFDGAAAASTQSDYNDYSSYLGGRSAIDILVCTPGRLVDHLDKTPGFTLQHLRFLVIDEADRLLSQSYQGWIERVCRAADIQSDFRFKGSVQDQNKLVENEDGIGYILDPLTWRRNDASNNALLIQPSVVPHSTVPLRKLLFSATLTKDPQKLAPCNLVHPKHYDARLLIEDKTTQVSGQQQQYSLPELLKEFTVHCTVQQKPLVAVSLILEERLTKEKMSSNRNDGCIVVIFTASLDSTHRLARLLQLLWTRAGYGEASEIAEYSSALSQKQRERLLQRCSDGSVAAIVCSDGMSRGMDIPSIHAVINYDIPIYAKTYVHRCGRTARAGREGKAISLLSLADEKKFVRMRELIARADRVKEGGVNKSIVTEAVKAYSWCTSKLQEVIRAENDGLNTLIPLGKDWYIDENSRSEDDDDSSDHSSLETDSQ